MSNRDKEEGRVGEVFDLRSAIRLLEDTPGQIITTDEPVDPKAELAGVYKLVGAGTPTVPPTNTGPAMLFERIKGYDGIQVIAGVLSSRERSGCPTSCWML
jgi:4-hydroxy-3-polyprenylbenzoate decarboxylase